MYIYICVCVSIYIYIYTYYIYIYIYPDLPRNVRNVIVRLPHPRSGDSQDQEIIYNDLKDKETLFTFMFMFRYFCLEIFFLYKYTNCLKPNNNI